MSDSIASPWTVTSQAPLSMGFSRQEYWSGLPFPTPEDLPNPEIELLSLTSPALTGGFCTSEALGKPLAQQYAYSVSFFFFQLHCLFFHVSGGQSLRIGSLYTPVWEMPKVANCGAVRFYSAYEGKGGDLAEFLTSWGSCCIIPLFSWWIPAFSCPGTAGGKGAHLQGWRPPVSRR